MSDDPTPEEFADPANWHPIEEHPYLNDPPKVTMTDTLRTRIAAVLKTANDRVAGFIGYDEMADAVIKALAMEREESFMRPGWEGTTFTRYVTEWEIEDELATRMRYLLPADRRVRLVRRGSHGVPQ